MIDVTFRCDRCSNVRVVPWAHDANERPPSGWGVVSLERADSNGHLAAALAPVHGTRVPSRLLCSDCCNVVRSVITAGVVTDHALERLGRVPT